MRIPRHGSSPTSSVLLYLLVGVMISACGAPVRQESPPGDNPADAPAPSGTGAAAPVRSAVGTVTADGLRLRDQPYLTAEVLTSLMTGDELKVLSRTQWEDTVGGDTAPWLELAYGEMTGWVYGAFVALTSEGASIPVSDIPPPQSAALLYDGNGATGGEPPTSPGDVNRGDAITVAGNTGGLQKNGAVFVGWNTEPDGSGQSVVVGRLLELDGAITLYAHWLDHESDFFSRGEPTEEREFIRSVEVSPGQMHMLVREGTKYLLSIDTFEEIVDPFILESEANRRVDEFTSEIIGFRAYPEHRFASDLIPAQRDDRYGYIDVAAGFTWAVDPTFERAKPFKEGRAAVMIDGKWGYIDRAGQLVVPAQYDYVFNYYNGLSVVANGPRWFDERSWGIIDSNGTAVLDPAEPNPFTTIYSFYEPTIAKARNEDRSLAGLGRDGSILITGLENVGDRGGPVDPHFPFRRSTGLAVMELGRHRERQFVVFDATGAVVAEITGEHGEAYREAETRGAPEGTLIASRDAEAEAWGYVDNTGEWAIAPQFEHTLDFADGVACVKQGGAYGVIDRFGQFLLEPVLDRWISFSDGRAAALVERRWGVLDTEGDWILEPQYDRLRLGPSAGSPILVTEGAVTQFVSEDGGIVYTLPEGFQATDFKEGLAFLYRPISEIDYETETREFEVYAINERGEQILPMRFIETVRQYLI